MSDIKKVVLAYSGGLDTSVILKWLQDVYKCEVVTFTADLGQGEELEPARAKALKAGIKPKNIYIDDVREEFVRDFVFPMFRANTVYEGEYLLGTSIARPLIAKRLVEIVNETGADAICHGATGKGNDQVRFELGYYSLKPDIKVIAPWKMPEFLSRFRGRTDMIHYSEQHGIPIKASRAKPYSEDDNLLHISHEAGILEDPGAACAEEVYSRTASLVNAPDKPEIITLTFKDGIPVKVENKTSGKTETKPLALFMYLNELGTKHGIGRLDMVENRFVGIKSRGVYETPGGTILLNAHRDLEPLVMDREVMRIRDGLSMKVAELIYNGFWFSPEFEFLMKCIDASQEGVDGSVDVQLFKGHAYPIARTSPAALYDPKQSSMDEAGGYDQQDAQGFIRINAVRLKNHTHRKSKGGKKSAKAA